MAPGFLYYLIGVPLLAYGILSLKRFTPYFLFVFFLTIFVHVFGLVWIADSKFLMLTNGLFLYLAFSQCVYLQLELKQACFVSKMNYENEWNNCIKKLSGSIKIGETSYPLTVLQWDHESLLVKLETEIPEAKLKLTLKMEVKFGQRKFYISVYPVSIYKELNLVGVKIAVPQVEDDDELVGSINYKEFYELSTELSFGTNSIS